MLLAALALASAASAYPWPVRPFDRQHPIRAYFGDPRTVFQNGILSGGIDGPGAFSFHQGIDISAPNGTAVYPVASGAVHLADGATLTVDGGLGVSFQYAHVIPVVGEGEVVTASKTVLGYVQAPYAHVHLSEIDGTHVVNPLQAGHLAPYHDHTKPVIDSVLFRNADGTVEAPLGLCGRVEISVDAYDRPPLPVPGSFDGLPVSPSAITFTLRRLDGPTVIQTRVAVDFRTRILPNARFWNVYARGTYQNAPRFGLQQYAAMPGRYLYELEPNFDTHALANGVYALTVWAADERGNRTSYTQRFSVLNLGTTCPGSLSEPVPPTAPPDEPPAAPGTDSAQPAAPAPAP